MVCRYCSKWRLKANVGKSAVIVISVEGGWKWGQPKLPKVSSYIDLLVTEPGICRKYLIMVGKK